MGRARRGKEEGRTFAARPSTARRFATVGTALALVGCAPASAERFTEPPTPTERPTEPSASATPIRTSTPLSAPSSFTVVPPATDADFTDERPVEASGLRVSLRDPARAPDGSGFSVRFVLTNVGRAPVIVFQRWNSWGAYQWRLAIEDAGGQRVVAVNPQEGWTRNAPTAVAIEPGGELVLRALVEPGPPSNVRPNSDRFTTRANVSFPLRVRGLFDAPPTTEPGLRIFAGDRTISPTDLWAGAIASPWLDVR